MTAASTAFTKSIALVGLMGVGKTSVGKRLAPALGLPFYDADVEIEHAAEMSIVDIFDAYGEPEFRRLEQRVIERLLDEGPCVLATGGGAYVQDMTRASIDAVAVTVWLNAEVETLIERTKGRGHRPLLNQGDPAAILARLKAERDPLYAQAQIHIKSANNSDEASTVQALMPLIKKHLAP